MIDEVKQVLQVLLFYGCVFNQGSSGGQLGSIPLKPKLICLFGANKRKVCLCVHLLLLLLLLL